VKPIPFLISSIAAALFVPIVVAQPTLGRVGASDTTETRIAFGGSDVTSALEEIAGARQRFVMAEFRGDTLGMAESGGRREAALLVLEAGAGSPEVIRELPWPVRTEWLRVALQERRDDWSRALLLALEGTPPPPGSPSRGPAALAIGLAALRLVELDPEDDSAFLDTQPPVPLFETARQAFLTAAKESFVLQDEAFYRLWDLAEGEGDSVEALAWADSLVMLYPRSLRTPQVCLTLARAALVAGDPSRAVDEARKAIPTRDSAELRWLLARAFQELGFTRQSAHELRRLIAAYGSNPLAVRAWLELLALGETAENLKVSAVEEIRMTKSMLGNPQSDALGRILDFASNDRFSSAVRHEAALTLCRFFYSSRRYGEAEPLLRELLESEIPETMREEAELILARSYRNTGRLGPMEDHYRSVMERGGPEAPRATWELGREFESGAMWSEAERVYSEGLDKFTSTRRYRDVLFRLGFVRVRLGRLEEASTDFRAAYRASRTASQQEQASFWLARTLRELGREDEAKKAAAAGASTAEPAGAYGVLLRRRFLPDNLSVVIPDPDPIAEEMLFDLVNTSRWPDQVEQHFLRGLALVELGDPDAARMEWEWAYELARRNALVVQGLALTAAAYNIYPQGVQWARMAGRLLPSTHRFQTGFERLTYPAAYYGDVVREAHRHGVDPVNVWALMRQESFYDPVAVSRAGALGLMQIMPYTSSRITSEAGLPPVSVDALFMPRVNIALGTRFFSDRLEEFHRRLIPTLASYNAGEEKSREWLELAGGDHEEVFIECIGYPETYDYVRRILWLNWVYGDYYGRELSSSSVGLEAR
jgi:soluble lytic murein transglycosylase-like protein